MEENDRLFHIIEILKSSNRLNNYVQLADLLNTNKAGISDLKKSRKKISIELLKSMKDSYPDINIDWILTGEGEMFYSLIKTKLQNKKNTPLIPFDAWAGNGSPNFCDEQIEDYYYVPEFSDADFLLRVKGNSMDPLYKNRDLVACKKIQEFEHNNKVYALYTKSMGVLIKRVTYKENGSHITLTSENPDYPPFDIPISDVDDIALILGAIIFNLL